MAMSSHGAATPRSGGRIEKSNRERKPAGLLNWLFASAKKVGVAAVIVTVVGYWFSYQDRIDSRQERAWNVVRAALDWSEKNKWGNIGQIEAVQTLTRDCDRWWRNLPVLGYLMQFFFRDCVPLKSLSLMRMDFGGLKAASADLSYGYFACGNFAAADLKHTNLSHASLMATELSGADLSGTKLDGACLFYADVSSARFTDTTEIEPGDLLNACIKTEVKDGKTIRRDIEAKGTKFDKIATQIPICPDSPSLCGLLGAVNGWSCGK
jgi:hypothetical protein